MNLHLDPSTHDLVVENFQFKQVKTKTEDLAQRLKIKLQFFVGEWFLDENYGIPYFQEIFVKGTNRDTIDDRFKLAISSEDGVQRLSSYSSSIDRSTRELSVQATVLTTEGDLVSLTIPVVI